MTTGINSLKEQLYAEILGRIKETDMSLPVKRDNYYYYSRDEKGKQYKIYAAKEVLRRPKKVSRDLMFSAKGRAMSECRG